jgi:CxxC motif-containing protein (DUF1111 family)
MERLLRAGLSAAVSMFVAAVLLRSQAPLPVFPGDPLPGITPAEFELFRLGLDDFLEVEEAEEGLGPAFNGRSCAECHNIPAVGGVGRVAEMRAGYLHEDGTFEALQGGTLFHLFSVPDHRCQVHVPPEANVIARRVPIPLFGAGLVEAIPDETIIALEDPEDANGDGISGRAARITDAASGLERVGRFGWKAQHATLLSFSGDAYRNEMGITNDLFRDEVALGIDPEQLKLCDPRSDLEDVREITTGLRGIDNFANFMKFLAPVEPEPMDDAARRGRQVFEAAGCAACHVPQLTTGRTGDPVFDRKPVNLFSDLLLHDIGTGDGIEQEAAPPREIRTPALWGLRFRRPLLHDGSASTLDEAIRRHAGEAESARKKHEELALEDRAALLKFLMTL